MNAPADFLPLNDPAMLRRAKRWLLLGVVALGVAGIFAGLLGAPANPFFTTALVEHVDLSVLIWFLTMASMLFTLAGQGKGWGMLQDTSFYGFAAGTLLMVLASTTGAPAYKSDYVPVIYHPLFFMGLALVMCGVLGVVLNLLCVADGSNDASPARFGLISAAALTLVSFGGFAASHHGLPATLKGQIYYEYLFWGGGHVLQFVHTQLVLVAWLWLAYAARIELRLRRSLMVIIFLIGLIAAAASIVVYLVYAADSDEFRDAFTLIMRHMNGVAPLILGGFITYALVVPAKARTQDFTKNEAQAFAGATLAKTCLIMSMLLFIVGGGLGYLIKGSNVVVPAHYHGSIIGITLAYMGVAYLLMPAFGWADVSRSRLAIAQPIIYGGGQLCWMVAMAILGEHGLARKTPGGADTQGMVLSIFKHSADGFALIGGLLFVFVVLRAAYQGQRKQHEK